MSDLDQRGDALHKAIIDAVNEHGIGLPLTFVQGILEYVKCDLFRQIVVLESKGELK